MTDELNPRLLLIAESEDVMRCITQQIGHAYTIESKLISTASQLTTALLNINAALVIYSGHFLTLPKGLSELKAFRKAKPTPLIFIGDLSSQQLVNLIKAGASDYLENAHIDQLQQKIETVLKEATNRSHFHEYRYRAMVQEGADLMSILDTQGNFLFVSESSYRILKYPPGHFECKNAFKMIHPDDLPELKEAFTSVTQVKRIQLPRFRFAGHLGRWHWIEATAINLQNDPYIGGIVVNGRDITVQVQQEKQIQLSNERYRYVVKATHDHIYDWDLIKNANKRVGTSLRTLFGYTNIEAEQDANFWYERVHPEEREQIYATLKAKLEDPTQQLCDYTYKFKKADGSYAVVYDRGYIIRNEKGKATRLIGAVRDITTEHREQTQKDLSQQLTDILSKPSSLHTNLELALNKLLTFSGAQLGEVWLKSYDEEKLNLIARQGIILDDQPLEETEPICLTQTDGIPGAVYHSQSTIFLDIRMSTCPKAPAAIQKGLVTAVGLPIPYRDKIVGSFVFMTPFDLDHFKAIRQILENVIAQIAPVLMQKKKEDDLNKFFNLSPDMLCVVGLDGYLKKVNPAFQKISAYSDEELLTQPFTNFVYPADADKLWDELKRIKSGHSRESFFESRFVTKNGAIKWLSWNVKVVMEEKLMYAVAKDVTLLREQQKALSNAVQQTLEKERARFGRELHDGLVQMLVGTKINLKHFYTTLKTDAPKPKILTQSIDYLDHCIEEARTISHGLLSVTLRKYGLGTALEEIAHKMAAKSAGIQITYHDLLPESTKLTTDQELQLYRIAQEATTNTLKHADATELNITLRSDAETLELVISDNGKGIDHNTQTGGTGMRNMQARADHMGGHIFFKNKKSGGLEITVVIQIDTHTPATLDALEGLKLPPDL
ncbi:sensor histidine kinase [Marinoscillum furvescens]|uniref:histidine kinase n=1 Tax=Marinoscillum furvescens DSM 4134 TaxID=1122208 RepID=A0A3D9L425_MARFU|nr:PAS domain S-box protein [Marinoscillum furvescens]RED99418.1 PAS domain S-box-containing protein [Marinoscillum furvescens DSM 4134]